MPLPVIDLPGLVGLQGFSLTSIPEPSTLVLAVLGLGLVGLGRLGSDWAPVGGLGVRRRHRERRKRRTRQRRLEKPFSERPGAMRAALSATWVLGVALWFMAVGLTHFTADTAVGVWKATSAYEQGHEHLGWR